MLKLIGLGKYSKLSTAELRAICTDDFIWDAIPGKVWFKMLDG